MPRTTLIDVLEGFPANDFVYVLLANPKHNPDLLLGSVSRSVKPPDFGRLRIFNLGSWAFFSMSGRESFPIHGIPYVVSVRSWIKMIGVAAYFIIAFVKNPLSFWNWPVGKFPRNSMGTSDNSVDAHSTIPKPLVSQKRPAFIRTKNFNLFPKTTRHWKLLHAGKVVNLQF